MLYVYYVDDLNLEYTLSELTVDKNFGGGLQLLALTESSVPNGASVHVAVILLGGNDGQNRLGRFILVDSRKEA
jgi:hypothetical protein